ncbi:oocyte zinc finger protein XlCOF6-like isoform X3 [Sphaeramia orbicularis]|uniref:oocyte zinc finger protein XlCOF6-like isoform X3 n=1 Tax=Sphaeramia orbicularis TaxID=375764 RepID=UPI0011807F32|nr:oocyte zinc finger protein XlCOF6-like isoform X3 [Sphaeramia orbicularis]
MSGPEAVEARLSAVLRTVAEAAVAELGSLLDRCSVNIMAALGPSAAGSRTSVETEKEKRQFNKVLTSQFASLMETWTKTAVEKILTIFQVTVCEANGESAEKKRGVKLKDATETKKKSPAKTKETPNIKKIHEPGATGREGDRQEKKRSVKLKDATETKKKSPARTKETQNIKKIHETRATGRECHRQASEQRTPCDAPDDPEEAMSTDGTDEDSPPSVQSEFGLLSPDTDDDEDFNKPKTRRRPSEPMQCPSCPKTFRRKCLLERHYLCHSKPHLCSDCGKKFSTVRGLTAHSRRHTGEKPYRCPDCSIDFAYKSTFERHMRRHLDDKLSDKPADKLIKAVCLLCEGKFTGMTALRKHRCPALTKTLVCSICPQTFDCRQSLADHENQHSGEKDFICEICGERFFSLVSLSTHRVTHKWQENCCDALGLGCSNTCILRNHLSQPSGQKLFTCDVCGKGCSHRSALKHHMLTHTGERPYVCETCGKRCGHASALQNHMRVHTGRKPGQRPVCDVCGKTFRCAVNLKYHMSVHTGERPYACEVCGKRFTNPTNLKTHQRLHTGEKPYRCGVCEKAFVQRSEFTKHQRSHIPLEEDGGKQTDPQRP